MKFKFPPSRKKDEPPPSSNSASSTVGVPIPSPEKRDASTGKSRVGEVSAVNPRIKEAMNHAILEAQQDGCTGNFKTFESPFGNFLLPVIPTRAELEKRNSTKQLSE